MYENLEFVGLKCYHDFELRNGKHAIIVSSQNAQRLSLRICTCTLRLYWNCRKFVHTQLCELILKGGVAERLKAAHC